MYELEGKLAPLFIRTTTGVKLEKKFDSFA